MIGLICDEMVIEVREIVKWLLNVVVKILMIEEGLVVVL